MRSLLAAFRFLTILPVPGDHDLPAADWAAGTAWYPLVGLVLGAILAALAWALAWLWPGAMVAALVLVAWVLLTGALHLDGFVDCCDALFASVAPERRLEILRDLHTGAFGVAGVALLLLTKYAALASLAELAALAAPGILLAAPGILAEPAGWLPLILIPTTARWGMTATIVLHPYARSEPGLGARAKTGAGAMQLATATTITLAVTAAIWWAGLHWGALVIVVVMAATMLLAAQWIRSRIGGLTGDAYGALCELGEAAGLLAASALAFRGLVS